MKTTKEERDDMDGVVLDWIKSKRAQTLHDLKMAIAGWPPNVAKQLRHMSGERAWVAKERLIDGSLQRLRRAGKIEFVKARWQAVVPMKVVLS